MKNEMPFNFYFSKKVENVKSKRKDRPNSTIENIQRNEPILPVFVFNKPIVKRINYDKK